MTITNKNIGIITLLKIFAVIAGIYLFYYWDVVFNPDISPYEHNYNICMKDYNAEYKGVIIKNFMGARGGCYSKLLDGSIYTWYYSVNVIKSIRYKDTVEEWEL
ncbi:MAG: hypothetical protein GXO50_01730, partial [Chlorobi bacterium]|nr:hypothetical protein [Chlorobiota bacterium]